MKDLEMARKRLIEKDLTLVSIKDGQLIYESKEEGIKPMYILATEKRILAKDSAVADRVIGKGAALLCAHIGIKKLYTDLISLSAREVLTRYDIEHEYLYTCEYIKNKDQTGKCPIEEMSMDIDDPTELIYKLDEFLNK